MTSAPRLLLEADLRRVAVVARAVRIVEIQARRLLAEAVAEKSHPEPNAVAALHFDLAHSTAVLGRVDATVEFGVRFAASAARAGQVAARPGKRPGGSRHRQDVADPGEPLARIEAEFRVRYELAAGETPSDADLTEFGTANALHACWPYWREFLASSLARLSLPTFVLPVLLVVPRAAKAAEATAGPPPPSGPGRTAPRRRSRPKT